MQNISAVPATQNKLILINKALPNLEFYNIEGGKLSPKKKQINNGAGEEKGGVIDLS